MASPTPQPRGYLGALIDRIFSRSLALPPELTSYTVTPLTIPLQDRTLAATLFTPTDISSYGLLLTFTPYPRAGPMAISGAHVWAARGYTVLIISARGTSGSTGALDPALTERADFTALLPWLRKQTFYPGSFAMIGASFSGYTQFALLNGEKIPDLVGLIPAIGPHDFARHHWGTGAFRLDRIAWADLIVNQEDPSLGFLGKIYRVGTAAKRLKAVYEALPVVDGVEAFFGKGKVDWLLQSMRESDIDAPYWAEARHGEALEKIDVPIFLQTGWMDLFFYQTMEQYHRLHERGVNVKLVVGPWTHMQVTGNTAPATLAWLDEHVAGKKTENKEPPVKVYITGAEQWRVMEKWPPATKPLALYLLPDAKLGLTEQDTLSTDAPPSQFTYDPADPTPTLGGPRLALGGKLDDTSLSVRKDVLCFTTNALQEDVEVLGPPTVELLHKSDNRFADLFVRLCEVNPRGRSESSNITEAFTRYRDRDQKAKVVLEMTDCGHTFKKGSKIRLLISGGSWPMYSRNLGTGENACTGSSMKTATHTVFHGEGGMSRLVLPVAV